MAKFMPKGGEYLISWIPSSKITEKKRLLFKPAKSCGPEQRGIRLKFHGKKEARLIEYGHPLFYPIYRNLLINQSEFLLSKNDSIFV